MPVCKNYNMWAWICMRIAAGSAAQRQSKGREGVAGGVEIGPVAQIVMVSKESAAEVAMTLRHCPALGVERLWSTNKADVQGFGRAALPAEARSIGGCSGAGAFR